MVPPPCSCRKGMTARAAFQAVLRLLHLEALARLLFFQGRQLRADRLPARLGLLRALRELEVLDFQRVARLALREIGGRAPAVGVCRSPGWCSRVER